MSKQRRIKKIVKSYLNRIKADGEALFNNGVDKLTIDKEAQITELARINKLNDGTGADPNGGDNLLLDVLGITNPGNPVTEVLDIDRDGAEPTNVDVFPRDAREFGDADGDGIGNNEEVVNLHVQLLAIEDGDALNAARVVEAATALTATGTHLATLQTEDANGNDDFAAYTAALTAFNTAVTTLETLEGNAATKVAEATAIVAAMSALPQPAAGITYKVGNTTHSAAAVYAGRAAKLTAIEALKAAIDAECGIAGNPERVADANRTAAAQTVAPAE